MVLDTTFNFAADPYPTYPDPDDHTPPYFSARFLCGNFKYSFGIIWSNKSNF
jgi:hypothetical protein